MTLRAAVAMGTLGLALAAPAHAGDRDRVNPFAQIEALLGSGALTRGVVREDDVTLLFDHLRTAILAASQGREPPPPPEALERRGEEIAADMKARGTAAGLILLDAFEAAARQAVRESIAAPAPESR